MEKQVDLVPGTRYVRHSDGEAFVLVARFPILLKQISTSEPRVTTTKRLAAEYKKA